MFITIACLVGGGQEIRTGEAGIGEWIDCVRPLVEAGGRPVTLNVGGGAENGGTEADRSYVPETTTGEFPAGAGFQMLFKCSGFVFVSETNNGFVSPGSRLRGVGDAAFVVLLESCFEGGGAAGVIAGGV